MRWTLPNTLTVFRLLAAPLLGLVYLILPRPWADLAALLLFVGAAVTDWFDGNLARRWKMVSRFGAMLDPIADKAMVVIAVAVLFGLYGLHPLVVIPATVILLREVFVSGLREFLGAASSTLAVTKLAKWKTTAQMVAVSVLLGQGIFAGLGAGAGPWAREAALAASGLWALGTLLLWVAGALTAITGIDYLRKAMPHLRDV